MTALLAACLLPLLQLLAQDRVIPLYDGAPPGSAAWDWNEAENTKNGWNTRIVYNVTQPSLSVFLPEAGKSNGTSVVICPGGAFRALSIDSEGFDVARWLAKKGVTCFVLKYRLVRMMTDDPVAEMGKDWGTPAFAEASRKVIPLSIADGRNAVSWVRSHADEFKIDPERVGIMGFSAGGTVAGAAAFGYNEQNRPDFVAPIYPFFPDELIGKVPADAPPMFLAAASDDGLDLAPHSVALYDAWLKAKKNVEMHLYAKGGHGFGMRTQKLPSDQWIERFGEWMQLNGWLTKSNYDPAMKAYQKRTFAYAADKTLPYRVLYPENYDRTKKYPLILFLHGAGERGNDNRRQLIHGSKMFLNAENRSRYPAIVLFPQCPENSFWANTKMDRTKTPVSFEFDYEAPANWPLDAVNRLVDSVMVQESVDADRVYVTGLSMGGMGTFEMVHRWPNRFAAAMPICGGGNTAAYDKRVKDIAFHVYHGDKDAVVDVALSRNMVQRLRDLKVKTVEYTEYPGVNHNSWDNAFADPDFLGWMFRQQRKPAKATRKK
jgi:predicted peptidase